jgi:hypothetical protein
MASTNHTLHDNHTNNNDTLHDKHQSHSTWQQTSMTLYMTSSLDSPSCDEGAISKALNLENAPGHRANIWITHRGLLSTLKFDMNDSAGIMQITIRHPDLD